MITVTSEQCRNLPVSSRLEWLLTNGIGGYSMGTVSGVNSRRYHGHLVSAIDPPDTRMVLLPSIEAFVSIESESIGVSSNQYVGTVHPQGYSHLSQFELDESARWTFEFGKCIFQKELYLHPLENRISLKYTNKSEIPIKLTLRPLVTHKFYHDNFRFTDFYPEYLVFPDGKTLLSHEGEVVCIQHPGADRTATTGWFYRFEYQREIERGLEPIDDMFCPCELRYSLEPGDTAILSVSNGDVDFKPCFPEEKSHEETDLQILKRTSQKFLVEGGGRNGIIAGYPWFTDWARDTMISLPGICLESKQFSIAKRILESYASQLRQGVLPNRFEDKGDSPIYNTVDATLWFVNSVYLTLKGEWDLDFAKKASDWCGEIYEWHQKGTFYGIHVDREDGLLSQGVQGVQLTWMDAKVGDWVVTPRHGKPIEINGLWVNALRSMVWINQQIGKPYHEYLEAAELAESQFENKFWHEMTGHYLDTADPADASLRPNQLIAMSLPFAPLKGKNAKKALDKIREELLTPYGLRTLGKSSPGYIGRFEGSLDKRDAAYHQGTVWPWLLGPYVSAVLKLTGNVEHAKAAIKSPMDSLQEYGLGGIAEVYDGDSPQFPGGCPWQAWSIAELIRASSEIENFE